MKKYIVNSNEINKFPDVSNIIEIIDLLKSIFFPGYFNDINNNFLFIKLREKLLGEIDKVCASDSLIIVDNFFAEIPNLIELIKMDLEAAYLGDPAALDYNEIILSYPGFLAIIIYRIAHLLYQFDVPYIPRMMTEYAHSITGIDIHPGATIGEYFFIDHGTGVVIGQTAIIGNHVRIYQSVTIGALSLGRGNKLKGTKRHPTIGNNVTIYAGASILGGETIIGDNVTIGSNCFIIESVSKDTIVKLNEIDLEYISKQKKHQNI